ncbi:MAG: M28 family peptidase [Terracidiphilus sp.]
MKRHGSFCGAALLFVMVLVSAGPAAAFSGGAAQRDMDAIGAPLQPMPANPGLARALARISPAQIQKTIAKLVSFHNRSTLSSMVTDLPPGTGVTAAADWIYAQFEAISAQCGGCLQVHRDTFTQAPGTGPYARITAPTTITNIYAVLPGSDPAQAARMILVSGHYDSRNTNDSDTHLAAPGANDDGSGTAVSLECARALSKIKFPATLVFETVAGEEQGLYGSHHMAEMAKQQNWQLEGVLNNDIVGGNRTPGDKFQDEHAVRVFSEPVPAVATPQEIRQILMMGYDSDSPARELAREITEVARTYTGAAASSSRPISSGLEPVLELRLDRFGRGSDQESFSHEGYAAIRFTEWREDFDHQHQNVRVEDGVQYGDLLKFVDFDYVARVARLNAATMAVMADAPPEPVHVIYPRPKVFAFNNSLNNTTIQWQPGPGAPADTRYTIVWRATAAANWQRAITAAKAGVKVNGQGSDATWSVTLPISKDNVVFGVMAVGPKGQRSPAVVPWPPLRRR